MNKCIIPGCLNYGRYCRLHLIPEAKEQKPIPKVAEKRKEINKLYKPKAAAFVRKHPKCELKMDGCTQVAQCVHHTKGKDSMELLLDENFWKAACFWCNIVVEHKDALARQKGLKLSKFS